MRINFTVTHDPNGTPTVIDDVQDISSFSGKRKINDPQRPPTTTISGRNAAALPAIKLYDYVEAEGVDVVNNEQQFAFGGQVIDFEVDYGFVSSEDRWTLTLQHSATELATTVFTSGGFISGDTLQDGLAYILIAIPDGPLGSSAGIPNLRLSTVNFAGLTAVDVIDKYCATGAMTWDYNQGVLNIYGPYTYTVVNGGIPVNYTDDGTGTAPLKYDRVKFNSLAEDYAPVIRVDPDTGSTVTVGTGQRTETFNTYSFNTTEATSLAQYYEILYGNDELVPNELSFIWSTIPSQTNFFPGSIQCRCSIKLRGTTYQTVIIGAAVTATPEDVRSTYYLVPLDITNYLTLDDTVLGVLDSNRLGL